MSNTEVTPKQGSPGAPAPSPATVGAVTLALAGLEYDQLSDVHRRLTGMGAWFPGFSDGLADKLQEAARTVQQARILYRHEIQRLRRENPAAARAVDAMVDTV